MCHTYEFGCNMSSSDSETGEESVETTQINNKQERFISILKKWPILLTKSQTPNSREKKKAALSKFASQYAIDYGESMTEPKILKKINNMKTEIKKKTD